ncbi:MAG: dihydrofolate reductase [Bacteroidales bacterium]|nr:dihydrofolate reductase [Bacteroidales bacterium]
MNTFNIIVAVAENNAIGRNGDLLWHIHNDMLFFKNTTKGHPVVMGRKTWESLQVKPLPKRENIVVTTDKSFAFEDVKVLNSIDEVRNLPQYDNEVFIIGGGTIYKEFLSLCNRLYVTKVFAEYPDADTFFPQIDMNIWQIETESDIFTDEKSNLRYQFVTYKRKIK